MCFINESANTKGNKSHSGVLPPFTPLNLPMILAIVILTQLANSQKYKGSKFYYVRASYIIATHTYAHSRILNYQLFNLLCHHINLYTLTTNSIQMSFTCHHAIITSHISMYAKINLHITNNIKAITNYQFTCHQYQFTFQNYQFTI